MGVAYSMITYKLNTSKKEMIRSSISSIISAQKQSSHKITTTVVAIKNEISTPSILCRCQWEL